MKQKPVYLPENLHKKLKIIAIDKGKTLSDILSDIVENALTNRKILPKR